LKLLSTVKAPLRVTPEQWTAVVSNLSGRAHASIGMVLFKRDDTAGAIKEFEAALAANPEAEPSLHYRLGRLYAASGRTADARRLLQKAARSPDQVLRERALAALAELK
jgi:tetratricopeptide (TPR) repeat protein